MSADWEGEREWQEKTRRIEALSDMSGIFSEAIDEVVMPEIKEQLDTEGRGRYAPLSPAYAARKRRLYGDRPILQATGIMYRSLTEPGAPHQIKRVGPSEAFFGTDLERARFHQRGRGRRRRKIIDLTREFRKRLRDFIAKKMGERLRNV